MMISDKAFSFFVFAGLVKKRGIGLDQRLIFIRLQMQKTSLNNLGEWKNDK